ncbi:MAG TPA: dihydrolipoamide acetyltransferase family protein [Alphaproteobacteria bacterium]|nr:dihydrolipoamide acetyltransferase family protein [Alphaproteobacteria bacterium]
MNVIMPQLGETVAEGTVSVWHKKVGDTVAENELLFEVSTDKVEVEVPAPASGVITEILIAEGETVDVGTTLAVIADGGNGAADIVAPAAAATASAPIARQSASDGPPLSPAVRKLVAEHGLDPAAISGSGLKGRITKADVLALVETGGGAVLVGNRDPRGQPLSPVVRKLLGAHGLSAADISGSGHNGRIKRGDVMAFVSAHGPAPAPTASKALPAPAKIPAGGQIIPLSKIRKLTGAHMVASKATSPHVLQAVEVDFVRIERARKAHGEAWKAREGFGLTYLPFLARAVCRAIGDFPHINASIDGDNLVVHGRVNLGIAVDLGFEGLMVPVVKDAHTRNVAGLALAIRDLSTRARDGKLTPDDLTEGTYTLSNSGPFGTLITAPVINQPQVAILSTDGVRKKPVVIESEDGDLIGIRPIGVIAQSFDHRAFDGAYSAAFLSRLREIVETTDWSAELS